MDIIINQSEIYMLSVTTSEKDNKQHKQSIYREFPTTYNYTPIHTHLLLAVFVTTCAAMSSQFPNPSCSTASNNKTSSIAPQSLTSSGKLPSSYVNNTVINVDVHVHVHVVDVQFVFRAHSIALLIACIALC